MRRSNLRIFTRRRRNAWLILLVVVSGGAMLLPRSWTDGLMGLVQVIVPFQHAASVGADAVVSVFDSDAAPVAAEVHEALAREKAGLEHANASLAMRVAELEDEVSLLTATRLWGGVDQRIGARGRLIPARVITDDILTWRSSRLINAGSLQGVRNRAAVVSREFSVDRGTQDGVGRGMAVLLAETLVGTVELVTTHTARIKLLSDASVEMKVRIGRFNHDSDAEGTAGSRSAGTFTALDRFFWLTGHGKGIMQIREVDRRDVEAGVIQVGDIVLADHTGTMLPAPMTVGKISKIEQDRESPLLATLTITSPIDEDSLRKIYVFDPQGDTE